MSLLELHYFILERDNSDNKTVGLCYEVNSLDKIGLIDEFVQLFDPSKDNIEFQEHIKDYWAGHWCVIYGQSFFGYNTLRQNVLLLFAAYKGEL